MGIPIPETEYKNNQLCCSQINTYVLSLALLHLTFNGKFKVKQIHFHNAAI